MFKPSNLYIVFSIDTMWVKAIINPILVLVRTFGQFLLIFKGIRLLRARSLHVHHVFKSLYMYLVFKVAWHDVGCYVDISHNTNFFFFPKLIMMYPLTLCSYSNLCKLNGKIKQKKSKKKSRTKLVMFDQQKENLYVYSGKKRKEKNICNYLLKEGEKRTKES